MRKCLHKLYKHEGSFSDVSMIINSADCKRCLFPHSLQKTASSQKQALIDWLKCASEQGKHLKPAGQVDVDIPALN